MKFVSLSFSVAMAVAVSLMGDQAMTAEPAGTKIGNVTFQLADGLHIEKVASDELLKWPIAATFDNDGDLLVLECHWNRESVQQQRESRPHKIVRLTDIDDDGEYDRRTVIADELGFPEGIAVLGQDLLVTTPPEILRLSDRDEDGFFETKEVWYDGSTLTHCANDLHGPIVGPDGWVYWTKGAFAEQTPDLRTRAEDKQETTPSSKAAHIYRRHPEGGPVERLMTGGMDNPSDLTFSPEGEIFFCSTFLHHPGNGLRDGIAHSPRGGVFGKPHQVLDGHWKTGPLLEPIVELGPAAPASISFLETNRIPTATRWYSENVANGTERFLVSAQFNLQKVGLHQLVPEGSSFQVVTHDLVTADRIDFHPVEILQEPDGNLLLFDTGGWYDLCCPSSGSDQSIAHGGVYRLKPKALSTASSEDAPIKSDPAELEQEVSWLRKQYLWAIARDITEDAAQPDKMHRILAMLEDPDATIQQTAARIVGLHRWRNATRQLESLLNSKSAPTVRTAIESLGVVGDRTSVGPIVKAASRFSEDRMVQHSAIYAILEIGAESELVEMASHSESDVERYLAIYALDQLQQIPDKLFPSLVINLRSNNSDLRQLSLQCLAKQPNGISLCIPFLETAWERREDDLLSAALLVVRQGLASKQIQTQVATWLRKAWTHSPVQQEWLVACLKQAEGQTVPQPWCPPLIDWVRNGSDESLLALAGAIRSADFPPDFRVELASVIRERSELTKSNPELALTLLAASPAQSTPISEESASLIKEHLSAPESRLATIAEAALARSMLTREGAVAFSPILDELPSVYLQTTLDALLRSGDSELDSYLLTKLASLPAVKSLDGDRVVAGLGNRSDTIKKKWREVFSEATKPPTDVAKSLDQWLEKLPSGDPARGYQVFRSAKAACATCHQVGYIGGNLGPELSKIGKSRTRRDLVESIVFPSQRIAQGFQPVRIRTVDGEVFNGLLSKQTDKYIELLCGADKLCRIDKASIEQQMESKVSVMPMGLDQQISLDEFADLIAYLESRQ